MALPLRPKADASPADADAFRDYSFFPALETGVLQHSSSDVSVASDAAGSCGAPPVRMKAAMSVAGNEKEETMRVLSQSELARCTKGELSVLLRKIVCELPTVPEGSAELRTAHANLANIRRAMARPDFRPR